MKKKRRKRKIPFMLYILNEKYYVIEFDFLLENCKNQSLNRRRIHIAQHIVYNVPFTWEICRVVILCFRFRPNEFRLSGHFELVCEC